MLQAGKLRHRVVIQKQIESQDQNTGAVVVTWDDVATVWASVDPLSAKEFIAAQQEDSKVSARITIRYRSDVTAKMRLYHAAKNKYYNIEGVLADKDSGLEYLTLPVSEGVRFDTPDPDAVLPVILENHTISGVPAVGNTLTATAGLWANEPESYEYQWYLDDLPIDGETGLSLIVPNEPSGILTFGVKAVNSAGTSVEAFSDGVIISA